MTPDEKREAYDRRLARRAAPQPRTTADATPSRDNAGVHAGRVVQRSRGQQWRDSESSAVASSNNPGRPVSSPHPARNSEPPIDAAPSHASGPEISNSMDVVPEAPGRPPINPASN